MRVQAMLPEILRQIFESLLDPQQQHAMMVHVPIGISVIGALGLIVLLLTGGRFDTLRWCCVAVYLLGAAGAFFTAQAGEAAMANLDTTTLTDQAIHHLEIHEAKGEKVYIFLALTGIIAASTVIQNTKARKAALFVSALASLVTVTWVLTTAHHGGALVYQHGVGVPTSINNIKENNAAQAPDAPTDIPTTTAQPVPPPSTTPMSPVIPDQPPPPTQAQPSDPPSDLDPPSVHPTDDGNGFFGIPTS